MVITCCDKEEDVAGEGSHMEVGHHFSGKNILVVIPGDNAGE